MDEQFETITMTMPYSPVSQFVEIKFLDKGPIYINTDYIVCIETILTHTGLNYYKFVLREGQEHMVSEKDIDKKWLDNFMAQYSTAKRAKKP